MSSKIPERWLTRIAPFPSISPMLADALEELGAAEQELDKYRRADAIMAEALRNREKECLRLAGDIRAGMKAELWAKVAQLQARNRELHAILLTVPHTHSEKFGLPEDCARCKAERSQP